MPHKQERLTEAWLQKELPPETRHGEQASGSYNTQPETAHRAVATIEEGSNLLD